MTNGIKLRKGKACMVDNKDSFLHGKIVKLTYVPRTGSLAAVIPVHLYNEWEKHTKENRVPPIGVHDFFVFKSSLVPVEFKDDEWE